MAKMQFILTGYEHGGTTLLSEIFRANGFEGGFECGVLLGSTPAALPGISPFWERFPESWNVTHAQCEAAIAGDFAQFYDRLCADAFPTHRGGFFDKTPAYMQRLGLCLQRAPFAKGAVVIHRDPRSVFLSMARRLTPEVDPVEGITRHFDHLMTRYLTYFAGSYLHRDSARVLFVPFEELVMQEDLWLDRIGLFASGQPFRRRMTTSRFKEVSGSTMLPERVDDYARALPSALQERILTATALASPFFVGVRERETHAATWDTVRDQLKTQLQQFGLPEEGLWLGKDWFEPATYLLLHPDVLAAGVNPVVHYLQHGKAEGRWLL